jgi:hypothetical protein
MQTSRRIYFNPTSIPRLRTTGASKRNLYNATKIPRSGWRSNASKGIRRESTETGEDRTGHISATSNEAILFFDSKVHTVFLFAEAHLFQISSL